jgi:DNA-binding beta-propeller fold protein YncE
MFVRRWPGAHGAGPVCCGPRSGAVFVAAGTCVDKVSAGGEQVAVLQHARVTRPVAVCARGVAIWDDDEEEVFVVCGDSRALVRFRVCGPVVVGEPRVSLGLPWVEPCSAALLGDRLLVADAAQHTVHVVSCAADQPGEYAGRFGTLGTERGHFRGPRGVAADERTGEVYVADTDNHRVQVLTLRSQAGSAPLRGEWVRSWGSLGHAPGQFHHPCGLALSAGEGVVAVADRGNHRVQAFDSLLLGRAAWVISSGLRHPCVVGFDKDDDVLVGDDAGAQWFAPPGADGEEGEGGVAEGDEARSAVGSAGLAGSSGSRSSGSSSSGSSSSGSSSSSEEEAYASEFDPESPVRGRRSPKEIKAASPKPTPAQSVQRRFMQDTLELKQRVAELQSQVDCVEREREQLEREHEAQVEALASVPEARAAANDLSSQSLAGAHGLGTTARIMACSDALLLEERALELEILAKQLQQATPALERHLRVAETSASGAVATAEAVRARLADAGAQFTASPDAARRQANKYQRELAEVQDEAAAERDALARRTETFAAAKKRATAQLDKAAQELEKQRAAVDALRVRAALLDKQQDPAARGAPDPTEVQVEALERRLAQLGGLPAAFALLFKVQCGAGRMLDAPRALATLRQWSALEPTKRKSIKKLNERDVEDYLDARRAKGFDMALLEQAFADL